MGNRKRKHREPLFWLEAAFIVLLLAGAYVIGSYARAKQSDSLQEVFVADHGTNVVEVTDAQGTTYFRLSKYFVGWCRCEGSKAYR